MIVSGSNIRDHVAQKFIDTHNYSTVILGYKWFCH